MICCIFDFEQIIEAMMHTRRFCPEHIAGSVQNLLIRDDVGWSLLSAAKTYGYGFGLALKIPVLKLLLNVNK